jgi:hypothetical protein
VDANALLEIALGSENSEDLADFVAGLCCSPKLDLSAKEVCDRIVGLAVRFPQRELSCARIVRAVQASHPECLETAVETVETVESVVEEAGDDETRDEGELEDPDGSEEKASKGGGVGSRPQVDLNALAGVPYPAFDRQDVGGWIEKLRAFAGDCEDWNCVRDAVFRDFEFAIGQTGEKEPLFAALLAILEAKGIANYERILLTVVAHSRERRFPSAAKVVDFLVETVDADDLVAECFRVAQEVSELARNAIDIATKAIQNVNDPDGFQKRLTVTTGFLNRMLADEAVDVRKAVVFCYVALYDVFGSLIDPFSEQLTGPQKKLIATYRGTDLV